MEYCKEQHLEFLEQELQEQTKAFNNKLNASALYLLQEKEELFVGQFIAFKNGEMILKVSNKRSLPRKGDYLYCFTVPKELRNFRLWGDLSYGDLIKRKNNFTEAVCIWQTPSKDIDGNLEKDFSLVGFRGVDVDFSQDISDAKGTFFILGPNKPPFEYILNLQKLVGDNESFLEDLQAENALEQTIPPTLLDQQQNIAQYILNQLALSDQLVLIGPPGTGKTYQIAQICKLLCEKNKSVLVTSLTNRALMEVAAKPDLQELLKKSKVFKTNLKTDEIHQLPQLQSTKEILPLKGQLILATFFTASFSVSSLADNFMFDYVIVDEASQGLLAMLGAAKLLGEKTIYIGDVQQLPPVVTINQDSVNRRNYHQFINGLQVISNNVSIPRFQLTDTYRLNTRASYYTGCFYNDTLISKAKSNVEINYSQLPMPIKAWLNPSGGPTLIKTDLKVGDKKPKCAIEIVSYILTALLEVNKELHLSVLTNYIETVKALQKAISQNFGNPKNLLVETVARIQGLTTDITILVIPNTGYQHSLEKRLFNVATSRSTKHTIIIADHDILSSSRILDNTVRRFLQELDREYSFSFTPNNLLLEN